MGNWFVGIIQHCIIPDIKLKKKHMSIAYIKTREAAAAGIVHPVQIHSSDNFADLLTKAVTGKTFGVYTEN